MLNPVQTSHWALNKSQSIYHELKFSWQNECTTIGHCFLCKHNVHAEEHWLIKKDTFKWSWKATLGSFSTGLLWAEMFARNRWEERVNKLGKVKKRLERVRGRPGACEQRTSVQLSPIMVSLIRLSALSRACEHVRRSNDPRGFRKLRQP